MKLNEQQRAVIEQVEGALMVLAPAGSGKTAMLALRIEKALAAGFKAEEMLCLTFTNLAARQLRERVGALAPQAAGKIWMGTFHGFCAALLRIEASEAGLPADFVILDEEDATDLMERLMREHMLQKIPNPRSTNAKKPFYEARDVLQAIERAKSVATGDELGLNGFRGDHLEDEALRTLCRAYCDELGKRHALDFSDLIYYVRACFLYRPEVREKWASRYRFLQVDEMQDTHLSEYAVIQILGRAGNIAFYGDLDQAIYGWRGSTPQRVQAAYVRDFVPKIYSLPLNYRATKSLIKAADRFAAGTFTHRATRLVAAPECPEGKPVVVYQAATEALEAGWIAMRIVEHLADPAFKYKDVAVLCRSNQKADQIGAVLADLKIPCVTAEHYNFFRRQEVKDAVACLRLLLNPHDIAAAQRLVLGHVPKVGEAAVRHILQEGERVGVRLPDFLRGVSFRHDDPFGEVLEAFEHGRIMVMDTETTGLNTAEDEVVELAMIRLEKGVEVGRWSQLIKSGKGVGSSQAVHGISDAMLQDEGGEAKAVIGEFLGEVPGHLLVGHNIGYDLAMVESQALRLGLGGMEGLGGVADTYEMARRFLNGGSYRLVDLCRAHGVAGGTAHRALGDVESTVGLLRVLVGEMRKQEMERKALVGKYRERFMDVATVMDELRHMARMKRPAELLRQVVARLGLIRSYASEAGRLANLERLAGIVGEQDNVRLSPWEALKSVVQYMSLAKNLDQLSSKDDRVVVVPIHQSKGLEFRVVFIAGAVEGVMPHFYSTDKEEEARLFYVAMTRPKEALYISGFKMVTTAGGMVFEKKMSRFAAGMGTFGVAREGR